MAALGNIESEFPKSSIQCDVYISQLICSGAGNDNNHAHPDTSMKLGRNVHWHELLEFFSLANQNWSIFKMAALKSKMAATINVKS